MSRAKWKGPKVDKKPLLKYKLNKTFVVSRAFEITSKFTSKTLAVHTGRKFLKINVTNGMVGHKIGEFCPTREKFLFKKKRILK